MKLFSFLSICSGMLNREMETYFLSSSRTDGSLIFALPSSHVMLNMQEKKLVELVPFTSARAPVARLLSYTRSRFKSGKVPNGIRVL